MIRVAHPIAAELLAEHIEEGRALLQQGRLIGEPRDYHSWRSDLEQWVALTAQALGQVCDGSEEANEFKSAASALPSAGGWQLEYERDLECVKAAIDVLVSLQKRLELAPETAGASEPTQEPSVGSEPVHESSELVQSANGSSSMPATTAAGLRPGGTRRVFLVHGRNERWKQAVVLVLERAGPHTVTILSERPNGHGTTVEQFEQPGAGSSYAVVLLTADDVGAPRLDSDQEPYFSPRACQGVVFEMGFLVAALTPRCVCVLYEDGVELPCDLDDITYVRLDTAGTWQSKLLLHLRGAGFDYDLNRLAPL